MWSSGGVDRVQSCMKGVLINCDISSYTRLSLGLIYEFRKILKIIAAWCFDAEVNYHDISFCYTIITVHLFIVLVCLPIIRKDMLPNYFGLQRGVIFYLKILHTY